MRMLYLSLKRASSLKDEVNNSGGEMNSVYSKGMVDLELSFVISALDLRVHIQFSSGQKTICSPVITMQTVLSKTKFTNWSVKSPTLVTFAC